LAVDISGRHAVRGKYYMVCAAVSAKISPYGLEKVNSVRQRQLVANCLDLKVVADLISGTTQGLEGVVVAEHGDLYNQDPWMVEGILGRRFKYPESLGEFLAIELAHHISLAGRRLVAESSPWEG
jgi:hypothetical protein